jgi:hypothetical protein
MARTRWLVATAVAALLLAVGFAFTLIGLVAEGVALLALAALAVRGCRALARRLTAHSHA